MDHVPGGVPNRNIIKESHVPIRKDLRFNLKPLRLLFVIFVILNLRSFIEVMQMRKIASATSMTMVEIQVMSVDQQGFILESS